MRLLIVDGSNLCMRAAFGGDLEPKKSTPIAAGLIQRAARQVQATHLVVAMDSPTAPSWRKREFPAYKANRTRDTAPWFTEAIQQWTDRGWRVLGLDGFEADDIIATVASRAQGRAEVFACSGDSDLLVLTGGTTTIVKPQNGGIFTLLKEADVMAKYGIGSAFQLPDFKALVGEKGDNVPGVPGIGPVKAQTLLHRHTSLAAILALGPETDCPLVRLVAEHAAVARTALRLVTLSYDAPVPPLKPSDCDRMN